MVRNNEEQNKFISECHTNSVFFHQKRVWLTKYNIVPFTLFLKYTMQAREKFWMLESFEGMRKN